MEEMNTQALAEETAPQGTEARSATEERSVDAEQSATSEQAETERTEQNSENDERAEQDGATDDGTQSAPFLSLRHNHELRELSQSETIDYVQRGLHAESIIADLRYLAANEGAKSVKDFIEALKASAEENRRNNIKSQLLDESNEELLNSILTAETEKLRTAAGVIEQNEAKAFADEFDNENTRIADEFLALKAEFPEIKEFKDVHPSVLKMADEKKISLLDAQLRFQHAENKKIKEAEQSAAAAGTSSTGSMGSEDTDTSTPMLDAMRKGVWL